MSCLRILAFLIVFISFAECLPPGNITHVSKRVMRFPHNDSTPVRPPSGGWARDKNTTSRIGTAEEKFVFPPDDDNDTPPPVLHDRNTNFEQNTNRLKYKPVIKNQAPDCADGSTFCEKVDGYPENIDSITSNDLYQFKELQGVDELKSPSITQRIDINATNEQPLCPSIEEVAFPRVAKNKDDKWLFVVNTGTFVQGVRVEKCLKTSNEAEQKCYFNDSFPNGYTTVCKQKYIYRRLVALDEDGKRIKDEFVLPSCCSCAVISVGGDVTFRQGMLRKALRTTTTPAPKP